MLRRKAIPVFLLVFLSVFSLAMLKVRADVGPAINGESTVVVQQGVSYTDAWVTVPTGDTVTATITSSLDSTFSQALVSGQAIDTSTYPIGQYTITYTVVDTTGNTTLTRTLDVVSSTKDVLFNQSDFYADPLSGGWGFYTDMIHVSDGIVAVGQMWDGSNQNAVATKFNLDGTVKWNEVLDLGNNEWFTSVIDAGNDSVIVSGTSRANGGQEGLLYKFTDDAASANGFDISWSQTFGSVTNGWEVLHDITKTSDGDYLVAGSAYPNPVAIKFADNGTSETTIFDLESSLYSGNQSEDMFQSVYEVGTNAYLAVGGQSASGDYNLSVKYFTVTEDSSNNYTPTVVWTKVYNGSGNQGKADAGDLTSILLDNNTVVIGLKSNVDDGDYASLPAPLSGASRAILIKATFDDTGVTNTNMTAFEGSQSISDLGLAKYGNGFLAAFNSASNDGDYAPYVLGSQAPGVVAYYDSNLNLVWGAGMQYQGGAVTSRTVATDGTDVYIGGHINASGAPYIAKLDNTVLANIPSQTNVQQGDTTFDVSANVSATDVAGNALTVNVANNPLDASTLGLYPVTYEVTNGSVGVYGIQNLNVATDIIPPTVTIKDSSSPITVQVGQNVDWASYFNISDNLTANPTFTVAGVPLDANNLPDKAGTYNATFTATDDSGNKTVVNYEVVVQDKVPPVITGVQNLTVEAGLPTIFYLSGVKATDNAVGTVTLTVNSSDVNLNVPGVYTVTYTATDASGNVTTATATITVVDTTPPVISGAVDLTVPVDSPASVLTANVKAIDRIDPHPSLTVALQNGDPVDLTTVGTYTIVYTAKDASGNTSTKTVTLNVVDTVPPVITGVANITLPVNSGTYGLTENVTVTDNYDTHPQLTLTYQDGTPVTILSSLGTFTIVYTATDSSGNTTTKTATITVVDNVAPTITGVQNLTVNMNSNPSVLTANVKVADNYDKNPSLTVTLQNGGAVDLTVPGTYDIIYTAKDSSGNTTTATATLTVLDNVPPVIHGVTNVTIAKGQSFNPLNGITATDNVDSPSQITLNASVVDLNKIGTQTVTVTATDRAGNVATATYTLTITHNLTPVYITGAVVVLGIIVGGTVVLGKKK